MGALNRRVIDESVRAGDRPKDYHFKRSHCRRGSFAMIDHQRHSSAHDNVDKDCLPPPAALNPQADRVRSAEAIG
jgi:hypothetical protein